MVYIYNFVKVLMNSQVCWDVRLLLWVPELLLTDDNHYILPRLTEIFTQLKSKNYQQTWIFYNVVTRLR
jgi:hypothetical protein